MLKILKLLEFYHKMRVSILKAMKKNLTKHQVILLLSPNNLITLMKNKNRRIFLRFRIFLKNKIIDLIMVSKCIEELVDGISLLF